MQPVAIAQFSLWNVEPIPYRSGPFRRPFHSFFPLRPCVRQSISKVSYIVKGNEFEIQIPINLIMYDEDLN